MMKSIVIPAIAALGLAAAIPAMAAPDDSHGHHQDQHQQHHAGPATQQHGPAVHQNTPKPPAMHEDHRAPDTQHGPAVHQNTPKPPVRHEDHRAPDMHHGTTTQNPVMRHDTAHRYDWNNYQQGHKPPKMRNVPKLDFHAWHRNFNAPRHFHIQPYHRPHGWYYRRWTFGMVLPNFFWSRDYWINDYSSYDLSNPPYGYVWVRYGDDALLVNVSSGYILQVEYGLFG